MKTSRGATGVPTARVHAVPVRAALLLLLCLLLLCLQLGGCTTGPGGGEATSPGSASATSSASQAAPAAHGGDPTTKDEGVPAVPQYRATLPPVARERPAPARFTAASIGVDLPVVRTGVSADGLMQLPETNREVAWYGYGSRPGDPSGTTVMAAHVDTRAEGLGPFARLRELRRGAELTVSDAAGRSHRYRVTSVDDVPKSRIPLDQLFRLDGPPGLTVLTCGGPFSRSAGYRDNIVVTAQPTR